MKNLNYINHEIGGVWHDFSGIKHANTPSASKSNSIAFEQVKCRGNVIPTLAESPSNHPLITRLSPANHPLLAVLNQVKRVMRAAMVLLMLFVGVGQMWAEKGFFGDGQWNVAIYYGSGSDTWGSGYGNASTYALGVQTDLYLKNCWVKTWSNNSWTQSKVVWYYGWSSGSTTNSKTATKSSVQGDQTWDFSTDYNLISNAPNNPGENTLWMYWRLDDYVSSGNSKITFTIPGFKSLSSTSVTFDNTTVGNNNSKSITYTHYGTAPTNVAERYSITGTNADQFSITALSGTGATIKFTPTSVGTKTATLVINDVHGKTTGSITLTGEGTAPTVPTLILNSVSPTELISGNDVTITTTRSNTSNAITFEYTTNNGTTWNSLTPKSTSNSGQTAVWTIPEANGATQTYKFRAKITSDGLTTDASSAISVYGKKTIHVRNINDWATFNSYVYDYSAGTTTAKRENWPGSTTGISDMGGQWKNVVLTSQYNYLILNNGSSSSQLKGETYTYSGLTNNGYYTISSGTGNTLTLTNTTNPTAPTVTTAAASSIAATSATLGGSVAVNRDKVTERGYYWSTDATLSASKLGVGTKVTISGTNNTDGDFSQSKTGLSNGTTYYVIAYATNGFGTSYGSVVNFRTKYVTTVTLNPQGGTDGTASVSATEGSAMPSGMTAPKKTGYTFGGYYANADGSGTQYYSSTMTSANNWDVAASTATIHAKWTAKTTTITLNNQDATTAGSESVVATYGEAMPAITLPTKTGYTFGGYWGAPGGSGPQYYNADGSSAQNWNNENPTNTLFAKWTAKSYTVTLDKQTSATGYGASGTCSNPTVTYNTALPAISGTMPSGTGAYGFAGFYTEAGGSGVKLINSDGTWVNNVASYTSADGKWIHADNITVYAFYKQAEITGITLNADIFEPVEAGEEKVYVKADPNIDPTPSSTTKICWELRYSNNNPVDGYTPIVDNEGGTKPNQVKFELNGLASGGYKIHAELRSGSDCAGTLLSSYDQSFSIANDHTVTIYYRLDTEDGPVIKASTTSPGKPLDLTEISAPNIVGYTFNHWKAGDGVTIDAENDSDGDGISEDNTISYTAIYDGKLTAVYTKKRMIYFMNTLGWSGVTVYFYKNDSYWDASNGTGSSPTDTYTNTPFSESKYGAMTQIEGTNIWYLDAEAKGVNATYTNVVFTEKTQYNYHFFSYQSGTTPNKVIRRGDYSPAMSMFVPLGDQEGKSMNSGQAKYYNEGYWMNYSENTGYTLRIYNSSSANNETGASRTFTFPYSENIHMPLKVDVDFNFTGSAWFMVYRHDGTLLGKSSTTLTQTNTSSSITSSNDKVKIQTSAPGNYTFTLTFHDDGANPKNYNYYINVDYPVGVGDYRILYKDNDKWSQSSAHSSSWSHPSDIIRKNTGSEEKSDTVSLFVSYGSTISAKFQKVTAINASTGAVTWADVASGTIDLSGISKKGVYNFIVSQPAGGESISLSKTEEYTGNFYIRTDCAGNTKWDSYRTRDHQMPYTDFSMSDANTFGDKFSHYYAHWCPAGTNIKFCVANDYSACISDTLTKDVGEPYKNLDGNGTLLSDGNGDATANRYSANVRFMYNSETNKLSRAYVSAATNAARKFLVLYCESGKEILDENGNALAGAGETSRQAIFHDNENFIYDRVLQIVPGTRFKLFASYALQTPTRMDSVQYFRGTYASDAFSSDENSVVLLSGTGGAQKLRVIYDFKTNRLVAAWMPSNEPISGTLDINADVMIIRDHHNAAECITFANSSSELDGVKTVYGAMKFNRWTLNNRARGKNGIEDNNKDHCDTPADITEYHPILNAGEQKSIYERSLYFISFPFDVKVSEIFGFGHYWDEWYLEYYDGLTRAQNGYWKDSPSNWKYVTPEMADTMVLRAYQGYILGLDLDYMEYDNTAFWANNISNVELYFPSQTTISSIKQTEVTIPALGEEYRCTINRGTSEGDRRIKDSFWRCIGVPSYNEFAGELTSGKGGSTINWQTSYSTFPFLYAWNMSDNTLTPQNTSTFAFKPMHAYLVQIQDAIYWNMVSATPSPIVARRERAEHETEHNWCLTLSKDSSFVDQTYVRMSNLEQVTNSFDFNQDLIKEMNAGRSNIYTLVGYERLAANSMPIESTNTTIIPVGVNIKTTGEYTFAMPEGTNGVGITLVDTETNVRTSLSAFNYTVNLNAGQYDSRFILEISPISQTTTGVEEINDPSSNVRKLMIDGILYIIHEGKMYDARGARVE